jgi:predicted dehydrogenase
VPRPAVGVGLLGHGFMGAAHSRALLALQHLDVPQRPELVSISGRNREALERARERWGWREAATDWREQVADDRIALFVNGGPNALHAEPTIAAVRAVKHVVCEKPLGLTAEESNEIWQEAQLPAVVGLGGRSGAVAVRPGAGRHRGARRPGRARRRPRPLPRRRDRLGFGTCPHDRPRARGRRPLRGDRQFENGVIGTLEASRLARGRLNSNAVEVNGSRGSLAFDAERLNELELADRNGFRRAFVTEPEHPYLRHWWPPGHVIGWGDTFVNELGHMLEAVAGEHEVGPHGATFEDGYRNAEVVEAILCAAESGRNEEVTYR